jgi:hypothetical protein
MADGRGRRAGFLGLGFLLAGCLTIAPKHEYELSPGRAFHPGMKSAVVLPINVTVDVPPGLEKGEREILAVLVASLEAEGLRVETPDAAAYQQAFAAASRAAEREFSSASSGSVSESLEFSQVLPPLLSELGVEADLVVVPNMVLRSATASGGRTVRWDGVQRRQPGTGARGSFTGTTTAASLWIDMREEKMVLLEDRLQDVANLREGVCIALHPFFGEDGTCRR